MTIQTINLGSYANDGTGDDLRTAFEKVNANFALLEADVTGAVNLGSGTGVFAQKNSTTLELKSLTSTDGSVVITNTPTTVDLAAAPSIVYDTNPRLGADLDLQEHRIYNGDAQTTVFGFDIPGIAAMVKLMVESGQTNVDFNGGYTDGFDVPVPTTANLDFNGTGNINFLDSVTNQTDIDLGTF
jgi:hypothetical protein